MFLPVTRSIMDTNITTSHVLLQQYYDICIGTSDIICNIRASQYVLEHHNTCTGAFAITISVPMHHNTCTGASDIICNI